MFFKTKVVVKAHDKIYKKLLIVFRYFIILLAAAHEDATHNNVCSAR